MKVYCKDCKNHEIWTKSGRFNVCKIDIYLDAIGDRFCTDLKYCEKTNKENDCKNFTSKFFKKMKYKK